MTENPLIVDRFVWSLGRSTLPLSFPDAFKVNISALSPAIDYFAGIEEEFGQSFFYTILQNFYYLSFLLFLLFFSFFHLRLGEDL